MRFLILIIVGCLFIIGTLIAPLKACTSFSFETSDSPYFGTNLDLFIPGDGLVFINRRGVAKGNIRLNPAGERLKWISKYGSVSFNVVGYGFVWSGMNEAGLVIGSMEVRDSEVPEPDNRYPLDPGSMVQYLLDTCGTAQDVIAASESIRMVTDGSPPSHYLVADAEGNGVGLEYQDGKLVVFTGDSLPVKAMSNMPYDRALEAYRQGGPHWWRSNPGRSANRMAAYDPDGGTDVIDYTFGTLAHVVSMPKTKWSIVYNIGKRQVFFGTVVSQKVKYLSLEAMDLSCDAPLLMFDVNSNLEGNVEKALMPYDHTENRNVFMTQCLRFGMDITDQIVDEVMRIVENNQCAGKSGI